VPRAPTKLPRAPTKGPIAADCTRAAASELEPFRRFGQQVANRLDGFLGHIRHRVPMGVVEALNSRLEGLIYRARGFRSVWGFIAVARFVCGRPAGLIRDVRVFPWSL
jgi:transposase